MCFKKPYENIYITIENIKVKYNCEFNSKNVVKCDRDWYRYIIRYMVYKDIYIGLFYFF